MISIPTEKRLDKMSKDMWDEKDTTEILFNQYEEKAGEGDCKKVRIPLFNTTRGEAIEVMQIIKRDRRVGMIRCFVSNGNCIYP